MFLNLVHKIYVLSPERKDSIGPINRPAPATTSIMLVEGGAFKFTNVLMEQMDRLQATFTQIDIDNLELKFKNFLKKCHADKNFQGIVQAASKSKTFAEQRKLFYKDYPMLVSLGGGLATTFPGTSTVESDFSVIGWEKDSYRTMLSNLSLEGILHAKQRKKLKHIEDILSQFRV